jgi:preprotein translocase subunit SecB
MAETPADPATAAENGVDVDEENQAVPRVAVEHQYIKDLSFENPSGPASAQIIHENPEVTVEVSTSARAISENRYEVCLIVHGKATLKDSPAFIVELTYAAVIALYDVPEDTIQPVLLIEGARIIFPFARNIVADVTRDGGFPPLFLQPIDFMQLYQEQHMADDDD